MYKSLFFIIRRRQIKWDSWWLWRWKQLVLQSKENRVGKELWRPGSRSGADFLRFLRSGLESFYTSKEVFRMETLMSVLWGVKTSEPALHARVSTQKTTLFIRRFRRLSLLHDKGSYVDIYASKNPGIIKWQKSVQKHIRTRLAVQRLFKYILHLKYKYIYIYMPSVQIKYFF